MREGCKRWFGLKEIEGTFFIWFHKLLGIGVHQYIIKQLLHVYRY